MNLNKRIDKLEAMTPKPKPIDIPISAWGFGKDRTEVERLTGIKFTWKGENESE